MKEVTKAISATEEVYASIKPFVEETVYTFCNETDNIISKLENIYELSNEDIRNAIVELSFKSYRLSDVKEKSAFKAECSETIRKIKYATSFNEGEGSVAVRENNAIDAISNEMLAEKVYDAIANILKTKLDEIHRVVDALKSVLVSRLSEEKLAATQTA